MSFTVKLTEKRPRFMIVSSPKGDCLLECAEPGDLSDLANCSQDVEVSSADYRSRMNRAIDHIFAHLDRALPLEELAEAAHFSPYHFHRIFKAATGETLHQFTKRVRLERALHLMSHQPQHSLTEIALRVGFASSSDFSRSFKQKFGVPPRAFDLKTYRRNQRSTFEDTLAPAEQLDLLQGLVPGENPDQFEVCIVELPPRVIAYHRVFQPYQEGRVPAAYRSMMDWAQKHHVADGQWMGYMWEDPEIVPLENCRYDVGVQVERHFWPEEEVSCRKLPAMKVAQLSIHGPIELEMRALDWLYKTWLPNSGFAPDHQPGFELWNGKPFAQGMKEFDLRLQLPIVSAHLPL